MAAAQQPGSAIVRVLVTQDSSPLQYAFVRSGTVSVRTNASGTAVLSLPAGRHTLVAGRLGLKPDTLLLALRPGQDTTVTFAFEERAAAVERVVVSATRTEQRVEDVPLRVEVLAREEVEEKMLMTPGDISMMLNETGGLRVQTTSPSLGAANLRVQGLRGRYTLMLSDGLPLYGSQSGSLGMLQIPPMDLAQVEVIKGVASALYGSAALGGVVNLLSRRPEEHAEREVLLNQTTRNGADAVLWSSLQLNESWGYTLLGGAHRQDDVDVDDDGWADLPAYRRAVVRPRAFWTGRDGRNALITAGATIENREGGTVAGRLAPNGSPFPEALDTRRYDAGAVAKIPFGSNVFSLRSSGTTQGHRHQFGATEERDRHDTWFGELSLSATRGTRTGVAGAVLQVESFTSRDVPRFDYRYVIPAAFAQVDLEPATWLAISASGRVDAHSEFGAVFNPRVSFLLRPVEGWSLRLSGGTGVFAPTPFTEETEATGLSSLRALPALAPERARSASADAGGHLGPFEVNATAFISRITSGLIARRVSASPNELEMLNATLATRTAGADALVRYRVADLLTTLSYTHVRSTEQVPEGSGRRLVPLTPRHTAGLVSVWEREGIQRIGLEAYFTGRQPLDENPYLLESRPYVLYGAMAERRVGRMRVFVNLENLGNVRMTSFQPLVRPSPGEGGRWTTDAWAPLDGRTFNGGVRLELGTFDR